jgi:hypothetical protein
MSPKATREASCTQNVADVATLESKDVFSRIQSQSPQENKVEGIQARKLSIYDDQPMTFDEVSQSIKIPGQISQIGQRNFECATLCPGST